MRTIYDQIENSDCINYEEYSSEIIRINKCLTDISGRSNIVYDKNEKEVPISIMPWLLGNEIKYAGLPWIVVDYRNYQFDKIFLISKFIFTDCIFSELDDLIRSFNFLYLQSVGKAQLVSSAFIPSKDDILIHFKYFENRECRITGHDGDEKFYHPPYDKKPWWLSSYVEKKRLFSWIHGKYGHYGFYVNHRGDVCISEATTSHFAFRPCIAVRYLQEEIDYDRSLISDRYHTYER